MKTLTVKNSLTRRPGAAALLSLALALPLVTSQTVVADNVAGIEEITARETTRDYQASSLRLTASGRADRSATVTWADLDLTRPAGLDRLYLRLTQATSAVCSPRADIRDIARNRDLRACLGTAMDNAVSSVGHLGLEEMHATRTGRNVQPEQEIATR